tara:strand:- start:16 stop:381 length:366 start_codon:yes stop_codon:yes gene_type:complete
MSTYIKIIHVFISIVAALTVGVLLAVFIGLATMIDSFLKFPVQVYMNLREQERIRRLTQAFTPYHKSDDKEVEEGMWEKHIRRMEGKKKKEQELKQQIEANSPYNDGWTKDFYQKQIDEDE